MTIFYKVGDPDRTVQTPNLIWDRNAGRAGLDEISVGNNWHITNVGNATALWNEANMTTLTINFNDTTIGKSVVVTVASDARDSVGIGGQSFSGTEWQEEINEAVQSTMISYFIENGDWTLNENGVKPSTDIDIDEPIDAFGALDAAD